MWKAAQLTERYWLVYGPAQEAREAKYCILRHRIILGTSVGHLTDKKYVEELASTTSNILVILWGSRIYPYTLEETQPLDCQLQANAAEVGGAGGLCRAGKGSSQVYLSNSGSSSHCLSGMSPPGG